MVNEEVVNSDVVEPEKALLIVGEILMVLNRVSGMDDTDMKIIMKDIVERIKSEAEG